MAGVCVLYCCHLACADDESPKLQETGKSGTGDSAAGDQEQKAVGETRRVNREEEQWDRAVNTFWRTLAYRDIEDVATVVMGKLWSHLFGTCDVQRAAWWKLRDSYSNYLREWCLITPLVPVETLKMGLWYALAKLVADDLAAVIGGTPQYEKAKQLLRDGSVVGRWAREIETRMMEGGLQKWVQQSSYTRWSGWKPPGFLEFPDDDGHEWNARKKGYRKHGLRGWRGLREWDPRAQSWHSSAGGGDWDLEDRWEDDIKSAIDALTRRRPGSSKGETWRRAAGEWGWDRRREDDRKRDWRPQRETWWEGTSRWGPPLEA